MQRYLVARSRYYHCHLTVFWERKIRSSCEDNYLHLFLLSLLPSSYEDCKKQSFNQIYKTNKVMPPVSLQVGIGCTTPLSIDLWLSILHLHTLSHHILVLLSITTSPHILWSQGPIKHGKWILSVARWSLNFTYICMHHSSESMIIKWVWHGVCLRTVPDETTFQLDKLYT